jgi:hemoglobin
MSGMALAPGLATGITDAEIELIVHRFYEKVRKHAVLGPVFATEMHEDWDKHLQKMCDFWQTVMFGRGLYKGNPLLAHRQIPSIRPEHFEHWLGLFRETLIEVCPNEAHVDAFYQKAARMAQVLKAG